MKKLILVAILFSSTLLNAQIPNSGFESWTTVGAYDEPDSWGTMNSTTDANSVYTATKGTPGSPGSSYLKLTSKLVGGGVVNGIAVSGVLDPITKTPVSGFAYTGQPISFNGKKQHMIYGSSQGGMTVVLTHWNTALNKRDTVAKADNTLSGMSMSWTNFSIPFTYYSAVVPDSCIIFLRASGSSPTVNDYLWVDNLSFVGSVAGITIGETLEADFSVYPNPTSDFVTISFNCQKSQVVCVEIFNISGTKLLSQNLGIVEGNRSELISLALIPKGVYLVRLTSEEGILEKSILVQ